MRRLLPSFLPGAKGNERHPNKQTNKPTRTKTSDYGKYIQAGKTTREKKTMPYLVLADCGSRCEQEYGASKSIPSRASLVGRPVHKDKHVGLLSHVVIVQTVFVATGLQEGLNNEVDWKTGFWSENLHDFAVNRKA